MVTTLLRHLHILAAWRPHWWLYAGEIALCGHEKTRRSFRLMVKRSVITVDKTHLCPACTRDYLERSSTVCSACSQPIVPGESVARGPLAGTYPHTHMRSRCCVSEALWCGTWGDGKLQDAREDEEGVTTEILVRGHPLHTGAVMIKNSQRHP
ncbi:MAG: hypothetical protein HY566_02450 [Candidatus Kerfeldbacteria bacterium]|nr:hypothetical protein [Candidatus Kerfeldbacteria bacterium]